MEVYRMMAGVYAANCYIVYDENKNGFIVDPGGDFSDIDASLNDLGVHLKFILLTHGHGDHIGAVKPFIEKYKIPIYASSLEKELLANPEINLTKRMPSAEISITDYIEVNDGDIIENSGFSIEVFATPGHTAGSVCYKAEDNLFTGDTLFMGSIGRSDLPTSSTDDLMLSLKEKIMPLDPKTKVFPGHGRETNLSYEFKTNPFLLKL